MEGRLVLDTEKASVWIYEKEKIVHHKLKKFIFGDDFKQVLTTGADLFIEYGCKKWLSDDGDNSALRQEDLDWGIINWKQRMIPAGWKYWAIVMPVSTIGKMNMRPLIENYKKSGVTVEIFESPEEGFEWLVSQ
jgi:hypothetical protein